MSFVFVGTHIHDAQGIATTLGHNIDLGTFAVLFTSGLSKNEGNSFVSFNCT